MNKRQLIEAIKDYPDDAPVVVAQDNYVRHAIVSGVYGEDHQGAKIYSISGDKRVIRFEL